MYKFIQKNQKKFLALFAVGLMVVFILPDPSSMRGGGREEVFRVGDEPVMREEAVRADADFEAVKDFAQLVLGGREMFTGQPEPGVVSQEAMPGLLANIGEGREMFFLLQKEATRQGLRQAEEDVESYVGMLGGFTRGDPAAVERGIRGLLLIRALADRVASGIKPSKAQAMHELAGERGQRVKLDLVHYSVEDFAATITAPTAEQLQKQFDKYKDDLAGGPTEANPFGFGYLVPSQVKLNYLTVPTEEVARLVRGKKGDPEQGTKDDAVYFGWREKAQLHYRANPEQYPASQPATQPATTTAPTTEPAAPATTAATTGPATKPTTRAATPEQEARIIEELIRPEVDRRADQIATAVADRLKVDYQAVQRKTAGAPEDFGTAEYLQRVKDEVREKHNVQLGVSEINEPKSDKDLRAIEGIGRSALVGAGESFPKHVMRWTETFVSAADKKAAAAADSVLSLNEPSRPFGDAAGNRYVFLIREAVAAHPPADLAAVKEKVEADLRNKLAFDAATEAAKKLRDSVSAESGGAGLAAAAKAAGKDVFTTPDFFDRSGFLPDEPSAPTESFTPPRPVTLLPGVDLPAAARSKLLSTAYDLLERATPDKPHPTELVTLPAAGRVVVAELADVERRWQDDEDEVIRHQIARELAGIRAARILDEYFKPAAVKKRLDYRNPNDAPAKEDKPETETAAAG